MTNALKGLISIMIFLAASGEARAWVTGTGSIGQVSDSSPGVGTCEAFAQHVVGDTFVGVRPASLLGIANSSVSPRIIYTPGGGVFARVNDNNTNSPWFTGVLDGDKVIKALPGNDSQDAAIRSEIEQGCGLVAGSFRLISQSVPPPTFYSDAVSWSAKFQYTESNGNTFEHEIGVFGAANSIPTNTNFRTQIFNSIPTATGAPSSVSVIEDTTSSVDLSSVTFADSDNDPLTVTLAASAGNLTATSGGSVTVAGAGTGSLTLSGSAAAINTYLDVPSNVQYVTPVDGVGPYTLTVSASDGTADLASNPLVTINVTPTPDVTNVTSSTANGYYKLGEIVSVKVTFDMTVTVTGTPQLALETGATDQLVNYTSGSGTTELTFTYTVQAGDTSQDLDYTSASALALNGGSITGNGYAADVSLPSPGASGSLGANKAIVIDTTPPALSDAEITLSGATGTGGVFKLGDTVTATWTPNSGFGDTNLSNSLGFVTVDFSAFGGGSTVPATWTGSAWQANYIIGAGSTTGATLDVSVTATDAAGNTKTEADTTGAIVDATAPTVTASRVSISGATGTNGTFRIGDTVTATWDNTASGDNNGDIASVSIDFAQFGGGSVAAAESSGTWIATYTITSGSIDLTNRNVTVTALDMVGNSSSQNGTNNVLVDNISPTVVDGDIAVSGGTGPSGAFKVGDTATVSWTANNADTVDAVEVNFSSFGGPAGVTATESNGVWTATYVLTAGSLSSNTLQVSVTAYDNAANPLTTTKATLYSANTIVPTVVVSGPTEIVTEPFTVDIEFSEAVSSDLVASEIRVENGSVVSVAAVSGSSTRFTATINPVLGNTVLVQVLGGAVTNLAGGNPNSASNEFTVFAGSVATAFAEYRDDILKVLVDDAERSLRSGMAVNQRMMQGARGRLRSSQQDACAPDSDADASSAVIMADIVDAEECDPATASDTSVPFDVNGDLDLNGTTLSSKGAFFGAQSLGNGTQRLVFGDFDVQHDGDTGSSTATLTGRVAWEQMTSGQTLVGYFVGGELAHSNIAGAFDGDQNRIGVTAGGYAVHELAKNTYVDGFFTIGVGRNNLDMANTVLALESEYTTRSMTLGTTLSGVVEQPGYEIWPELSVSYGRTWIGTVGFTGRAYGLVDDALSLDAGSVSLANIMFRPEFRVPMDGLPSMESLQLLTFAPRLICEKVKTTVTDENCGAGAEIGFTGRSGDGLGTYSAKIGADRLGNRTSSTLQLNLEQRF